MNDLSLYSLLISLWSCLLLVSGNGILEKEADLGRAKHLFILSGQSNMARLVPDESFTPAVASAFGKKRVIVVKDAQGGQPIRRWYKDWKPKTGNEPAATGDLYDQLMTKVKTAINGQRIKTVTFIWMQGERDAREEHGEVYAASLRGLLNQLQEDLDRSDINFVIGRLSDFDMENEKYPHWTMVRNIQVKMAAENPGMAWVNCDDLNDGLNAKGNEIKNDLHMTPAGYVTLGQRFAEKAIELIRR